MPLPQKLILVFCLFIPNFLAEKVPSAANIGEYDDPMLDEIFADSINNPQQEPQSPQLPASSLLNGHLEKMDSSSPAVAGAAKNVIDPNSKPPPGSIFSNPGSSSSSAINNFAEPLGRTLQNSRNGFGPPIPTTGFEQAAANNAFAGPLTDLAFQAGQQFYSGVRQASKLFGIDAGQYQPYEVPIISQGARLFGRRRK